MGDREQVTSEQKRGVGVVLSVGDEEDGKTPQNVRCADCSHVWVGLYLPQPIAVAAKMMKNLTCPKCGADSKRIRMAS